MRTATPKGGRSSLTRGVGSPRGASARRLVWPHLDRPAASGDDRGYDADRSVEAVTNRGGTTVLPPRRNRKVAREFDRDVYKERNQIERLFDTPNQFRNVATRYDKLLVNYMGFFKLAAIAIWLKSLMSYYGPVKILPARKPTAGAEAG